MPRAHAEPAAKSRPRAKSGARSGAKPTSARKPGARPADRSGDRLGTYRAKRHFDRTPEPSGTQPVPRAEPGPRFVVQKHAASRLHYDFRLELDGVLLSWAVPKGPSLQPGVRRLAARTEDHPLDYADFEGVIPEHEYGGGTVVVWDRGRWQPDGDPHAAMQKGRLTFALFGDKLRGRWHLVKTRGQGSGESWLLFKGRDEAASDDDIVATRPESVITGRTLEEVGAARDRVWHSSRPPEKGAAAAAADTGAGERGLIELVGALPVKIKLTNLDKVLYPEQGLTKAALVAYLAVAAEWMLPQLAGRPLTLVRCPEGHHKHCFFQKHAKEGIPEAIRRIAIPEDDGRVGSYMMVDDLEGLIAVAQLGALELHTWGAHADKLERPDQLVFDLDPDEGLPWARVVEGALELRTRLRDLGLESFVKTTGGKGLHVVAPVERRIGWDDFKAFAKGVAEQIVSERPDGYTSNMSKARRKGRIFIDYLRNGRGATAIAAYSPRARPGAPVATPITWAELESNLAPIDFTITTVARWRSELRDDPWAGYAELRQSITAAARRKVGA